MSWTSTKKCIFAKILGMEGEISVASYIKEITVTAVLLVVFLIIRMVVKRIIIRFGRKSGLSVPRVKIVLKYVDLLLFVLGFVVLIVMLGVEGKQALVLISSIFTVIGVAIFAQWSVLSNITAGIIIFFYSPFRIGDKIRILDKDEPIEADIIDIKSFYTLMVNEDGERVTYPNNLLLQKGIVIISKNEAV